VRIEKHEEGTNLRGNAVEMAIDVGGAKNDVRHDDKEAQQRKKCKVKSNKLMFTAGVFTWIWIELRKCYIKTALEEGSEI